MIIGFAGPKTSGKSTAAGFLQDRDWQLLSFASTLKLMARVLMTDCGLSEAQILHHQADKEAVIPIIGQSYRHLCQSLGTEWGRRIINKDIWIITAKHKINQSYADVVFDDVRGENEAALIREMGGLIVHVRRSSLMSNDAHESERPLAILKGDQVIYNDGDEDDLYDVVMGLLK